MKLHNLILVYATALLATPYTHAQTSSDSETKVLQYVYDASGNRIKRAVVSSPKSPTAISGAMTDSLENVSIIATPNPTTGPVNIEISGFECKSELPLELYSLDGGSLLQSHILNSVQLDLASYPSGWYIVRVHFAEIIKSVKILKM